ncbi:phytase [Arthrobacter sp. ISL-30]|uniref:phytase n=1 Tax=Arthrobacter sp. ISL-30 TaxID=2819109 RepID=UPI001BE53DBC|nr:phytase [Arthrobacter sp. ISL-30]MBT2514121.1 phytase [Arthrobacter sp. ISL-30]
MAHTVSVRRTQAAGGSLRHAPTLLRLMLVAVLAAALSGVNVLIAPQAHAADVLVTPSAETTPVPSSSDAADDTAIWIHPTDPSQSVVIGTDKLSTGGVGVYDLSGRQLHFYLHGSMNNVDLRYNFPLGSERIALVGVTERNVESTGVRFYKVNVADRSLTEVGRISTPGRPRGFGMYHSPVSGKYYAFVHDFNTNVITQFELDGSNGSVRGTAVRSFDNGDSSEGISADDELQRVYVSEEKVGLWRYGAEPGDGSTRTLVDRTVATGGRIVENVKNSAIYYGRQGTGYLIVSSQGGSNFVIYNRGDNAFVGSFKIIDGGGVDGVNGQDGIDVTNFPLGPSYPAGLFTSQDHNNTNAGNGNSGNQNHKLVSWQRIADAFSPRLLVDTTFDPRQIGAEGGGGDPGPDTTLPNTSITGGPSGTSSSTSAEFTFTATEPGTFECALDGGAFEGCTSPKKYADLAVGSHVFAVRATDAAGNSDPTPAERTWIIDISAPQTETLAPTADAYVSSAAQTTNYGTAPKLVVDNSPVENAYLKFDLSGLAGKTIVSAKLQLRATTSGSTGTQNVRLVTEDMWTESGLTYSTRPTLGSSVLGSVGPVTVNTNYEVPLSASALQGEVGGILSLGINTTSSDGADFGSRETTTPPRLVLQLGSGTGTPPQDTTAPTVTSVTPAENAPDAAVTGNVTATFSEAMDSTTVNRTTFTLAEETSTTPVDAVVNLSNNTATLDPTANLHPGTQYTARVTGAKDSSGNTVIAKTWTFTTAAATTPSETVTLTPTADAYVSSAAQTTNYGTAPKLAVDNSPVDNSYLKFDLSGLAGKTIVSAKLQLRATTSGSTGTQNVRLVTEDMWTESGLTYSTRPTLGSSVLGSVGPVTVNTNYEVPLSASALQGEVGGILSLGINTTSSDGADFGSRETTTPPKLVLQLQQP